MKKQPPYAYSTYRKLVSKITVHQLQCEIERSGSAYLSTSLLRFTPPSHHPTGLIKINLASMPKPVALRSCWRIADLFFSQNSANAHQSV